MVDPLTLFALANGAVSAVKAGCKLYKEVKSAAGDVQEILKDLDKQFHDRYGHDKAPAAAVKQLAEEKTRVRELSKKQPDDIYAVIGEHLGAYFENMAKCQAVFDEQERHDNEVYTDDISLGKRALQRVLMRKKLVGMGAELRELMVYQCPAELGSLYTEVAEAMKKMEKQQRIAVANQMQANKRQAQQRARTIKKLKLRAGAAAGILVILVFYVLCLICVVEVRKKQYPELGENFWPEVSEDYNPIIYQRNRDYWANRLEEYETTKKLSP